MHISSYVLRICPEKWNYWIGELSLCITIPDKQQKLLQEFTAKGWAAHKFVRKARASGLDNEQEQTKAVQPELQPKPPHRASERGLLCHCHRGWMGVCTCFAATSGTEPGHWTLDIRHHAGTTAPAAPRNWVLLLQPEGVLLSPSFSAWQGTDTQSWVITSECHSLGTGNETILSLHFL